MFDELHFGHFNSTEVIWGARIVTGGTPENKLGCRATLPTRTFIYQMIFYDQMMFLLFFFISQIFVFKYVIIT